jgi:hypothetical protein
MKQEERLLAYLEEHKTITAMEAFNELGIFRLASRVFNLKRKGCAISSKLVPVMNRYGESCHISEYKLEVRDNADK